MEKTTLFKPKVRHVGIFDFKETYRILFEWFLQEGYEVNETAYKEIQQANNAKEVYIYWEATKKISDYYKMVIKLTFHPVAMTSVEVDIDGVKQKMNKGDLTLEFDSTLVKDYSNKWEEDSFVKNLRRLYENYLVRERTDQYEGKLISDLQALTEYVKSWLVLTGRR